MKPSFNCRVSSGDASCVASSVTQRHEKRRHKNCAVQGQGARKSEGTASLAKVELAQEMDFELSSPTISPTTSFQKGAEFTIL